jgi:hypothetical protein
MNQKELREIRRRIRPEHNSISHLYGCYVNGAKEIISTLDESMGLLTAEEQEKYLALLKKSLSGSLGRNLLDIAFATKQVLDSDEHRLLSALRKSEGQDAALLDQFYRTVIEQLDMDGENYLILLAFDRYDVPHYGKDGSIGDAGEVYRYMLCAVCPVKGGKNELGYAPEEKRFHSASAGQIVSAPELGFLFPSFDDRAANLYNALFYSRDSKADHADFIEAVFKTEVPMPAGRQRETFDGLLSDVLEQDCRFDLVQSVHEQLSERISLHKESKDPEPLTVTAKEMGDILENSGASAEERARFEQRCEESFGKDAQLRPANLSDSRKMEIQTPEVKIQVSPEHSELVQARVLDGKKVLIIDASNGVELNGVPVKI